VALRITPVIVAPPWMVHPVAEIEQGSVASKQVWFAATSFRTHRECEFESPGDVIGCVGKTFDAGNDFRCLANVLSRLFLALELPFSAVFLPSPGLWPRRARRTGACRDLSAPLVGETGLEPVTSCL
jgi:hypothetical protein